MRRGFHFSILSCVILALTGAPAYVSVSAQEKDADTPPWSQADAHYPAGEMAAARAAVLDGSGHQKTFFVMTDRLEYQTGDGSDTFLWDADAWYGGDINKIWFKSEGEYSFEAHEFEDAEVQLLYSRAISPFFDLQTGVRYDFEPGGRTHAVLGLQGIAPYWFEIDAATFLSTDGDLTARVEVEYEFLISQRLILQHRAEIEFSAQDINELNIGAGITDTEAGLRLRYEIAREFAPYVGVSWARAHGETADMFRANGDDADTVKFVMGLRVWH